MLYLAINVFSFVEYLPEDGQKGPKYLDLQHVCMSLYQIIEHLLVYIYIRSSVQKFPA